MITVIIAGGAGTRLWPLSTPNNPKQLLTLTSERTMVQQAYDRASRLGGTVYIVTESSHADKLRDQLPELPSDAFLIEPGRRGTAHCIIFALDYITRHHKTNEPVAFIHSDHNVRNIKGFKQSFQSAATISQQNDSIALVGIEPTAPSTGFGYIECGDLIDKSNNAYTVKSFKEKPDYETAKKYFASGDYLWNGGYFVGSVDIFVKQMQQFAPTLMEDYSKLRSLSHFASEEYYKTYLSFDIQAIDTVLIEKMSNLFMISASFDWMDIGNFKDLYDVLIKDEKGNYCKGENIYILDTDTAYVRNEEPDKPVAVIGLDNIVVVNTPNGVLVARKDIAAKTSEITKMLNKKLN